MGVPISAVLIDARSGGKIHIHQAKALAVAAVPFEVVRQGPVEVASQVRAAGEGVFQAQEIPVQEILPVGVVDLAVQTYHIVAAQAVFRDVAGQAVPPPEESHAPVQNLGSYGPFQSRSWEAFIAGDEIGRTLGFPDAPAVVDVKAQEIRLLVDDLQLLRCDGSHQVPELPRGAVLGECAKADGVQGHLMGEKPVVVEDLEGGLLGGGNVGFRLRIAQPPGGGNADSGPTVHGPDGLGSQTVG